jgi:cell division septum initiation protein DivIVA
MLSLIIHHKIMDNEKEAETVSNIKDTESIKIIGQIMNLCSIDLTISLVGKTDEEVVTHLRATKAALRVLTKTQRIVGQRQRAAGQYLKKIRQQRVALDPSSRKVILSLKELKDYDSWKESQNKSDE